MDFEHWFASWRIVSYFDIRISDLITFMVEKNFKQQLEEIAKILAWFDEQEALDVEEALTKIKKASELIKSSKKRLVEIEN